MKPRTEESYTYCDDDALPASLTKASSLTPNQFHKLCPATHTYAASSSSDDEAATDDYRHDDSFSSNLSNRLPPLGQPRCGDGTNFSFFVARPMKQLLNTKKILIEFQGGGACWDQNTCNMQQNYLTFPQYYDDFVGKSCTEIEYAMSSSGNGNKFPLSMLCAKSIGDTDFREYTTIVVPYCTQDVHLGDNANITYNGQYPTYHVGAHNMYRTLQWVFSNFPNPTHIFLTGCSAGGTAVPIAYDLINKHYNSLLKGGGGPLPRAVSIASIMDSSVYLTPSYFLQNYFGNWNPETIMNRINFNFDKYRYDETYPDMVWDHVLRRGSNSDRWGFVTHSTDPISLMYYQYMSGNGGQNRQLSSQEMSLVPKVTNLDTVSGADSAIDNANRHLGNYQSSSQWWYDIEESMNYIQNKHKNVDFYIINSEGHCSFGLYYPLQDSGFEEWASPIVKESKIIGNTQPSVASFMTSLALGALMVLVIQSAACKQRSPSSPSIQGSLDSSSRSGRNTPIMDHDRDYVRRLQRWYFLHQTQDVIGQYVKWFQSWPWTAGYLFVTTFYFISMLIVQGFAHPLDNPALGPSAAGLSAFGINNPTLVIYLMQHFRLVTSSFLCSGAITYLLVAITMFKHAAVLENALVQNNHPRWTYLLVTGTLLVGTNLIYACLGNGASCSALAFALGLNSFSLTLQRSKIASEGVTARYPSPVGFTAITAILACTPLLPYDSLVAIIASIALGMITASCLFVDGPDRTFQTMDSFEEGTSPNSIVVKQSSQTIRWWFVNGMWTTYLMLYLVVLFRIPTPSQIYMNPYLTGCGLVYSDDIGEFVDAYSKNNRGRFLNQNGNNQFNQNNMCAQMCIPHLAYRPALWGTQKFAKIPLQRGTCEENGYEQHVADKTFKEFTVTFEVELYTVSGYNNY